MKLILTALAGFILAACAMPSDGPETAPMTTTSDRDLILLAAPPAGDDYYADVADEIFDFHVAFSRQIEGRDRVLILADTDRYDDYVAELGKARVMRAAMLDIWTRDFGLSNAAAPVMFRYTAEGQAGQGGQRAADEVQEALAALLEEAGAQFHVSDLKNDGGNLVDDYAGRAVISRKFLRDNRLTETAAREALKQVTGLQHVAFIEADEQGGLEHADGMVAFVEPNVLAINSYPEDPDYAAMLRADLEAGLSGVKIHELPTPYDGSQIMDEKFGSACGLYTNMLVTPRHIYLPQFGIPEDRLALEQVRAITSREVVPVQSGQVCRMGGGVRCMSMQLRGANADRLLADLGDD